MVRYVVPDTCAIGASLYKELYSSNIDPMLDAIRREQVVAIAPDLGLAEFLNLSRKKLDLRYTNPVLSRSMVDEAVDDFLSLPIDWIDIRDLALNAWHLYEDNGVETADAFFVEVARQWEAEIWTIDTQFFRAVKPIHNNSFDLKVQPFF